MLDAIITAQFVSLHDEHLASGPVRQLRHEVRARLEIDGHDRRSKLSRTTFGLLVEKVEHQGSVDLVGRLLAAPTRTAGTGQIERPG